MSRQHQLFATILMASFVALLQGCMGYTAYFYGYDLVQPTAWTVNEGIGRSPNFRHACKGKNVTVTIVHTEVYRAQEKQFGFKGEIYHPTFNEQLKESKRAQCSRVFIDKKYLSEGEKSCYFATPNYTVGEYVEIEFLDAIDGCKLETLRVKPRFYDEWHYTGPRT
jgi:hypothetical protein